MPIDTTTSTKRVRYQISGTKFRVDSENDKNWESLTMDDGRTESTKMEKQAPNPGKPIHFFSRTFTCSSSGRRPHIGGAGVCVRVAQDLRSHYTGKRIISSVTSVCWFIIHPSSRNHNCFPPWIT